MNLDEVIFQALNENFLIDDEFYEALTQAGCKFGLSEIVSINLTNFVRCCFTNLNKGYQARLFGRMCRAIAE